MAGKANWFKRVILGAAAFVLAAAGVQAAEAEKPVAGKQVHFEKGTWSALPQQGPDGKVRQCVLVAPRTRVGKNGPIDTHFTLTIGRGAGFAISLGDSAVPSEFLMDDQAEIIVDGGRSFPTVGFTLGANSLAMHPGDAATVLSALEKTGRLTLRADGVGIDIEASAK